MLVILIPVLQARWVVKGNSLIYYGLREKPNTFKNKIKINHKTINFINQLDGKYEINEYAEIKITRSVKSLIKQKIIVDVSEKKTSPESLDKAAFCAKCCANDFSIPGLELNSDGFCPVCTSFPDIKQLVSPLPVVNSISRDKKARFDVALFYSGGKDSSYLLFYLSRILGLRVLALTWMHPFMSDNALKSIKNAKERLPEVTFVIREASETALKKIYAKSYELQQNICICPSIAYILFYPLLLENPVPYLVLGNEPSQSRALIFNQLAPKFIYRPWVKNLVRYLCNIGRVTLFRRPFSKGQLEMYLLVKNFAYGKSRLLKFFGYDNEISNNLSESLSAAKEMLIPLQYALQRSKNNKNIPALVHVDFDKINDKGSYDWKSVKRLIKHELDWVDIENEEKGLHTSCKLEQCKDYTQLKAFKEMNSRIIPFSSLELSLAVIQGSITRDKAIEELKFHAGFCINMPEENKLITDYIK